MSRMGMKRCSLEVRLSHPSTNQDSNVVSELVLTDRTSLKTVAIVELTLRDYHNLMTGRITGETQGVAYLATPSDLAKLRHTRLSINRVLPRLPSAPDLRDKLEAWVREAAQWMGSDDFRVTASNTGRYTVTVLLYVAPMDASDPDKLEEYRLRMTRQLESLNLRALGVEWRDHQ